MSRRLHPAQRLVDDAYRRSRGPVAFLDESYSAPTADAHRSTFYLFTSVLVRVKDMDTLRCGLVNIAGSDFWHTSDALKTDEGRARTRDMLGYLAEGVEPCVITHRVSVDDDDSHAEAARKECYQALAIALAAGRPGMWDPVDLLILEERNQANLKNCDQTSHKELVSTRQIPRHTRLVQTSPTHERLLWLPDLAASAYRRTITHNDRGMFDVIKDQAHFVALPQKQSSPRLP